MITISGRTSQDWAICLASEFQSLTSMPWKPPQDLLDALGEVFVALGPASLQPAEARQRELKAVINAKLKMGQPVYKRVLDAAAEHQVYLNYHQKVDLQRAIDYGDKTALFGVLLRTAVSPQALTEISRHFRPPTWEETLHALQTVLAEDERAAQVQRSLFSAFAFLSFQTDLIHGYFAATGPGNYFPRFYDHLRQHMPQIFNRPIGLIYFKIDDQWLDGLTDKNRIRAKILTAVKELSQRLSNHCYFAILLKPLACGEALKWTIYSDVVIYAEKHNAVPLKKAYFQADKVARQTQAYVANLDVDACQFHLAHEGLYYKDCFVISYDTMRQEPDLLLLFEKNERDETLIPCPACRSSKVQGNSYPVLGVRSWECNNLICPERSKYDRGNRYSLASLIRQEAIEEEDAVIPLPSLRLWKRDVVTIDSEAAVLKMLVQHYSLLDDHILLVNTPVPQSFFIGRRLVSEARPALRSANEHDVDAFFNGPYFHRFCIRREAVECSPLENISELRNVSVYCRECIEALHCLPDNSVDGIVTSPPYYNARDYAQWPNIYCFLYDQYNMALELYRILKPGGLFLYNIFDYFDNENNIVFSAMGKKRMILGAYAINLFRRAGFEIQRNVVWDKGEIEGKRNFNQGNRSPYYQAPFNCWEHVLAFSKGGPAVEVGCLPFILRAQPVVKMVGGRNVLGHTAPYPEAVPNLLINIMEPRSTVLDPYSGSMTTGRAAFRKGLRSISIDYKEEYCRLGLNLLMQHEWNLLTNM